MKLIRILSRVLPMKWDGDAFTDRVSGARVSYYRELSGRRVMASGPLSLFRVETRG